MVRFFGLDAALGLRALKEKQAAAKVERDAARQDEANVKRAARQAEAAAKKQAREWEKERLRLEKEREKERLRLERQADAERAAAAVVVQRCARGWLGRRAAVAARATRAAGAAAGPPVPQPPAVARAPKKKGSQAE